MRNAIRAFVLIAIAVVVIRLALPFMGTFLVAVDPSRKADAIVVLGSTTIERALEAGALYREGVAPVVIISHPSDARLRQTFDRLHLRLPTPFDIQRDALMQLGVPASALRELPGEPLDTRDEAVLIGRVASQLGLRTIVVVTSTYHTRRAGLYIRRTAKGRYTVAMRGTRFESVHASRWWRRRYDRIDVILEWIKLPKYIWSLRA